MKQVLLALAILLTLPMQSLAKPSEDDYQRLLEQAGNLILPAHQQLQNASRDLADSVSSLCANPNSNNLAAARKQWQTTMNAWMEVSVLQFGPLLENDRRLRIQAWPMRERLLVKAVRQLVEAESAPTLEDISYSSVAVQGLPALEHILFADNAQSTLGQGQTCAALNAISAHLIQLTTALNQRWQEDFGKDFSNPAGVAGGFDTAEQAFDEYMNGLVTGLQQLKRRKLEEPLGLGGSLPKPDTTESPLSGHSLENLKHNLTALIRYLRGGEGYGVVDQLRKQNPDSMAILILEDRLQGIEKQAGALTMPLEQLAEPKDAESYAQRDVLEALFREINLLNKAFENQIFDELGVTRDFNSEDGD